MGHFYYAARAFDMLERMDPNPEYWEGKRGACAGAFQLIVAGHEPRETLREILLLLRNTSSPQAESMVKVMRKWARDNKVNV
jgi:intraflagellar transport protein 56